jgi:hypothetical protein
MNGQSWQAWPSHTRLAKMCSISKRTAERATKELESFELLHVSRQANCANRYEMRGGTDTDDATDRDDATDGRDGGVPTAVSLGTDEDDGGVPTRMSPEPLNITSDRTSEYITSDRGSESPQIGSQLKDGSRFKDGGDKNEAGPDNLDPLAQPNLTAPQASGFIPRGASATSTTTPTHLTYRDAQALGLGPPAPRFQKIRARW